MGLVIDGHDFLSVRTLKYAVSQECIDEFSWFFAC